MNRCHQCHGPLGLADLEMVRHWFSLTTGSAPSSGKRQVTVCPVCDAYALGAELGNPLPFYSDAIAAFVTVNDSDWWNCDPQHCDIREWPDFGCLTFSESALHSAIEFARNAEPELVAQDTPLPFDPMLLGVTGIPEDEDPECVWRSELNTLHSRLRGAYSLSEIDAAIRKLIRIIAQDTDRTRHPQPK